MRTRSPSLAAWLSVVPGAGQAYNGQFRKAAFFPLATLLTIAPAVLLITRGEEFGRALIGRQAFAAFLLVSFGSIIVFLFLILLGLSFWAGAVVDARRSARELSEGREPGGRWWLLNL